MKYKILILFIPFFVNNAFSQTQQAIIDSLINGKNGIARKYPKLGLSIGIFHDGKTSFYSYGTRLKESSDLIDSTTIFEVGSATKTMTGLLLALEIQNGKINEGDYIDRYLSDEVKLQKELQGKVKITNLASHQSGLPNLSSDRYFDELFEKDPNNPFMSVDKKYLHNLLNITGKLDDQGSYSYNNFAYSLLGDILERVNNKSYSKILEQNVLKPLKMVHSTLQDIDSKSMAGLYDQRGKPQESLRLDAMAPAGALKSNAIDIMRYLKAQIAPPADIKNAIEISHKVYYDSKERQITLGWEKKNDYFEKDGDTFGNSCLLRFSKERMIAIVILSNHQNGALVRDAANFIYERLGE